LLLRELLGCVVVLYSSLLGSHRKQSHCFKIKFEKKSKMVGQRGFEPLTNGYLQLQNFVIPFLQGQHTHSGCASGAHRNTWLYYYPKPFTVFNNLAFQYLYITPTEQEVFTLHLMLSTPCFFSTRKDTFKNPMKSLFYQKETAYE
jgi:hypothetical protein